MMPARASRVQLAVVLLLLLVLHFYLRPRLWGARVSPDFMFIGLMLFAMRSSPGAGAVAGFLVGLATDALTPVHFGAGMLAHTVVGYLASWGRSVFFAENPIVNAAFVAVGLWVRDLLVMVASGGGERSVLAELTLYSPLEALTTALFALLVLVAFREWFSIRLDA
ncbi:MAG TPA: rod shape-determining protein MreD [Gemmatimonadales bacterium]|jgi:rod shape-determining protein MreD|nr:rod shape-determining protein MreD [Gemmatimonadales bacterium]